MIYIQTLTFAILFELSNSIFKNSNLRLALNKRQNNIRPTIGCVTVTIFVPIILFTVTFGAWEPVSLGSCSWSVAEAYVEASNDQQK